MDGDQLGRRIFVIVVSTRAAWRSLPIGDPQADAAVRRGLSLLDAVELDAAGDPTADDGDGRVDRARSELSALLAGTAEPPQSPE